MRPEGGLAMPRPCLRAGLVDDMHLAAFASPPLGVGEPVFAEFDLTCLRGHCIEREARPSALQVVLARQD
jgi:hypothetical protein